MVFFKKRFVLIYDQLAAKPRVIEISPAKSLLLAVGALAVLGLILWNVAHWFQWWHLRWRLVQLVEENHKMRQSWQKVQSQLDEMEKNLQHSRLLIQRLRWILQDTQALTQGLPQPLQQAVWESEKSLSQKKISQQNPLSTTDTLNWMESENALQVSQSRWQWQYDRVIFSIDRLQNQLVEQQQNENELMKLLSQRQAFLLALPVAKPVVGWYSSFFGYRVHPLTGVGEFHEGVDIVAEFGSPVMATGAGVVIYTGYDYGYGKWIEIDHGFGITTRYGHLSHIYVKIGQNVSRYDVIGAVGNTGRSTGPHLHYEVRINRVPQNPLLFIWDET